MECKTGGTGTEAVVLDCVIMQCSMCGSYNLNTGRQCQDCGYHNQ